MTARINIFDKQLGIQDILAPQSSETMPLARPLPQTSLREAGIDELFASVTTDALIERSLVPATGDGTILTPSVFSDSLANSLELLKDNKNPDIRSFVRGELMPLLDNRDLMQAYIGLLVGG
ncbi:MAG: type III secretion protein [Desulfovibrionaceae bacterium]|nr:type III secretion protein [Desulfovibrionaceae bacterium]